MDVTTRLQNWLISVANGLGGPTRFGALPAAVATEAAGWQVASGSGPSDRDWGELRTDLEDALEAWRKNFLVRQIVRLTTAFVVGDGFKVSSENPEVDSFIKSFWRKNNMDSRTPEWVNEVSRVGELFPILFTNKVSGMSVVRVVPASCISYIETDADDYELELAYLETKTNTIEPKRWLARSIAKPTQPMMLHMAVNRPVGATRGEGDLGPILPWAKRYAAWLNDRVVFNKLRSELAGVQVRVKNDHEVEARRAYYKANPPTRGSITVTSEREEIRFPAANIQGFDAEPDGRALRLAIASGSNIPLHFFGEGASATRATATEMGDPTHRHYRMRQRDVSAHLIELCEAAYRRYAAIKGLSAGGDLGIRVKAPDVSRTDNKRLAESLNTVVQAFSIMKDKGWITDRVAVDLAFQFAGEVMSEDEISNILAGKDETVGDFEDGDSSGT